MTEPLAPFLESRPEGLFAPALRAWIDPAAACPRAILTHAHADHRGGGAAEHGGAVALTAREIDDAPPVAAR